MAGITVPIVAVTGEPDAVNNFTRALMRTQQTTLGIVVYSLVSGLIWPTSSRSEFEGAARMLIENQRQLLACYMAQLTGGSGNPLGEDGAAQLRGEVTRALGGLHTRTSPWSWPANTTANSSPNARISSKAPCCWRSPS
mgnify:CR=1 FL=1